MTLLSKEYKTLLNTPAGLVFLLAFLLITGSLLWLIPGAYNISENGYASPDAFFSLAPVVLMVLIPAFSSGLFSEEKKRQTLEVLLTRPIRVSSIIAAKTTATFLIVSTAFVLSLSHLLTISYYAVPQGNMDWGAVGSSYTGMLLLAWTFVSIAVCASALTANQAIAFILALIGCTGYYYGFELLSTLFSSGKIQLFIKQMGLYSHVVSMQRGVVDSRDLVALLSVSAVFFFLTCHILSVKKNRKILLGGILSLLLLNILSAAFYFRWDLTSEKRYTISNQSKSVLKHSGKSLTFEIYLAGDLNAGFTRLKQATIDMLSEFSLLSPGKIHVHVTDPYQAKESDFISRLNEEGIRGIAVNERDRAGKITQKTVFPWLKITDGEETIPVSLLIHTPYQSGEKNLNASIENLEYQLIRNISYLTEKKLRKIAFLEGHAELPEPEVGDITEALSHYYQVDRGQLTNDMHQLSAYECVIIAGAQMPFSEQEKFILDQYLMKGGRLLFLINGVKLLPNKLAREGQTPTIVNDINLDDMLFTYGIRINPVLVEDRQCLTIPVKTNITEGDGEFKPIPWYLAPILYPALDHPVTRHIMLVKSEFASSLTFVGKQTKIRSIPLLSTSGNSHIIQAPEMIDLRSTEENKESGYFREQSIMIAALLEGTFTSVFDHRSVPEGINALEIIRESVPAKIIVTGSEAIIRNETERTASGNKYLPAGYDKYMDVQFGNRDFLINAVNYLTDRQRWMNLKNKHLKIRLLDRERLMQSGYLLTVVNITVPIILVLGLFFIHRWVGREKYIR
ncbi:MAG: gliding motility-associated ABC transporter substrate-binding protein GldG [Dysgonamonadaceae bacterium]|jgi:ABC-2 type transport system permease protein|nr:gliding motility-associated ABC transporter substrate-binding protein GldG [Dysgonamonadaceae bacterium]